MKFFSNVVGDSNDENSFPHKLLLTNEQASKLHKILANNFLANIKLSKTQLHKLGPLLKTGLPLIENVLKPLAKSIVTQLGLTAAVSATNAATHKKIF